MKKNYNEYYNFPNKKYIWSTIWPSLLYLGMNFWVAFVAVFILIIANINNKEFNLIEASQGALFNIICTICIQLLVLAVILPFYLHHRKKYYPKPKEKLSIKIIILSICFLFVTTIPFEYLLTFIQEHFIKHPTGLDNVNQLLSDSPFILTFISAAIFAPIVEELTIRGLTLNKLLANKSMITSIIVSALLFGIIHLNVLQGIFAFFAGCSLAYIFVKTKSIIPCIICHAANNFLSVVTLDVSSKTTNIITVIILIISIVPAILFIKEKEIEFTKKTT